ncbi:MAG: response regulator [Myxococcales bacterium]|nr:response regulator [Myxococcales bacterium]
MARDTTIILRVLLIEDNPGDAVLIREALSESRGPVFALDVRPSLTAGIEALAHGNYDALLLDLSLPECRGLNTLIRLRAASVSLPTLVLSGLDDEDTALGALQAGAQDYLVKGRFDGQLLSRALRYAIERKRTRDEIQALNAELESRVQQRTAELGLANQELEGFIHSITHDLRTPLRSIHGFAELLSDEYADQLDGEGRDYLERLVAGTERLEAVLDALLALSRLTRTTLRWEMLDLTALARRVAADQRRAWPDHPVDVEVEGGMTAVGDPRLIRIALTQLLSNAWKFTRSQREPRVSIGRAGDAFYVRDNGIGFDMAHSGTLFKPFQRLHSEHGYEGIGVGLATAWRIIQRHGGRMWAEGAPDEGACFYFTLEQRLPADE